MRLRRVKAGFALVLVFTTPAAAEPLSCDVFKDRLNGSILAAAGTDAEAAVFTPGFADPVRGTRYDWQASGLKGTMSCGPSSQFEEFVITLQFQKKETFSDTLKHFVTLMGASICALASDGGPVCQDTGRAMLQQALEQMGLAYNHGSKAPSGLADRTLFPGATAELTSAPSLITFVLGPGRGGSLDAARQALVQPAAKTAE